jgi:polynucleotide 5'-hydroxyl-kinase GRC3/NOL9
MKRNVRCGQEMRYLFTARNTLIIRGPASFRLLSGTASVLGGRLDIDHRVVVRQEKQVPVETGSEADFEILVGDEGGISEIEGSTIPNSWIAAAGTLAKMGEGRVVVIGTSDVGKSSLCTYLVNSLVKEELSVRLIDADVGQADVGPPTTISSSTPIGPIHSLTDLKPQAILFIGDIAPGHVETKLIEGTRRLSAIGQKTLTIIDTDGWVLDPQAIWYKMKMIEALEPDLVIGISIRNELQPILSGSKAKCLQVQPPGHVLPRTRSDRRQLRTLQYRKFLDGGTVKTIPTAGVLLKGPHGPINFRESTYGEYTGLIAGLLDPDGFMLEIGVTMSLERDLVKIHTRWVGKVKQVEFGQVRLTADGVELGYVDH